MAEITTNPFSACMYISQSPIPEHQILEVIFFIKIRKATTDNGKNFYSKSALVSIRMANCSQYITWSTTVCCLVPVSDYTI